MRIAIHIAGVTVIAVLLLRRRWITDLGKFFGPGVIGSFVLAVSAAASTWDEPGFSGYQGFPLPYQTWSDTHPLTLHRWLLALDVAVLTGILICLWKSPSNRLIGRAGSFTALCTFAGLYTWLNTELWIGGLPTEWGWNRLEFPAEVQYGFPMAYLMQATGDASSTLNVASLGVDILLGVAGWLAIYWWHTRKAAQLMAAPDGGHDYS